MLPALPAGQVPAITTAMMPAESRPIDHRGLWSAFRRRWLWATLGGGIVGLCAAAVVYFMMETPYHAFAEIRMKSVQERLLFNTAEAQTSFQTFKQTQMKLVKSPFVLNAALRRPEVARLTTVRGENHPVDWLEQEVEVSSPATEFIRISLRGEHPADLAAIVNAVTTCYMEEIVNSEENRRGERLRRLERIQSNLEEELRTKYMSQRRLAETLHTSDSETVTVKHQLDLEYFSELRKKLAETRFELTRAKIQLAVLENARKEAEERNRASEETESVADDKKSVTDTDGNSSDSESTHNIPEELILARLAQEPQLESQATEVLQLERQLETLKDRVKEDHPELARVAAKLEAGQKEYEKLEQQLRPAIIEDLILQRERQSEATLTGVQSQIELLQAEYDYLTKELENQKADEKRTGTLSYELETVNKAIEQTEKIVQNVKDEIQRLQIELQSPSRIALHRKAEPPRTRETGRKLKLASVAGFGMFGLIFIGVIWIESLTRRVCSLNTVVDELRMRVIGGVPLVPRNVTGSPKPDDDARRVFWKSRLTESIDAARTMILKESENSGLQVVLIASALGGEGKSTLACHLSSSLARAGRKTLLIDGDMRRPSVHEVFDIPLGPGLSEVLLGDIDAEDAITSPNADAPFILPAGKFDRTVLRQLSMGKAEQIVESLRGQYDLIILDSSPILPVTDTLLLAPAADGVVFSIRRDVSRVSKVSAASERLAMLDIPILGAVVIGIDQSAYGVMYNERYRYAYGYPGTK
ncbi:Tyrosine-protein kinase YwqD [Calycomorphotria hydatis]|uniref:non-specific protein-tyrosine kinase n=2 Tax=Calycomorphotria hydatis TaxID=2528027 RepID=A0A517T4K9_9PLAN|nr:Tyrosine-protein kinase YwqD [Calycomorphotria hydatis]